MKDQAPMTKQAFFSCLSDREINKQKYEDEVRQYIPIRIVQNSRFVSFRQDSFRFVFNIVSYFVCN